MTIPAEWNARVQLDPSIDPTGCAPPSETQKEVFLTGATGFLGAFLLEDLLRNTDARVHCLVRAPSAEAAAQRLKSQLEKFEISADFGTGRIVAIAGDLGKPLLGMGGETFDALGGQIDSIIHCGAQVALMQGYKHVEAANVGGTLEILRMATSRRLKPVNYISTIGTAGAVKSAKAGSSADETASRPLLETDSIDSKITLLHSGYAQSKWVAEKLCSAAIAAGIPGRIFRPGYVSGHTKTGVSSLDDNRTAFVKVCADTGVAPSLDVTLDMYPVDAAAAAIVAIAKKPESLGRVFHVINPNTVRWSTVLEWLGASGYPISVVPQAEWAKKIASTESAAAKDPARRFLPFQAEMEVAWLSRCAPVVDCTNLVDALGGTGVEVPRVDYSLWRTYERFLVKEHYLQARG
jgi:thioester reductase-like protein